MPEEKKPPRRPVPAVVTNPSYNDEDDELTPVTGIPIAGPQRTPEPLETIAHRTRQSATDTKEALLTVATMRQELIMAIRRDELEHSRLGAGLSALDKRVSGTSDKLEVMNLHVGNIREACARTEGKLDILVGELQTVRQSALIREKVTIETQAVVQQKQIETQAKLAQAEIEDKADSKKVRREFSGRVVGVIAGAIAALTTALVTLINNC